MIGSEKIFIDAYFGGYAVAAFAADDLPMCRGILRAAEELAAPVALRLGHDGYEKDRCLFFEAVRAVVDEVSVPVAVLVRMDPSWIGGKIFEKALSCGFGISLNGGTEIGVDESIANVRSVLARMRGQEGIVESDFGLGDPRKTDTQAALALTAAAKISLLNVPVCANEQAGPDIFRLQEISRAFMKNKTIVPLSCTDVSDLSEAAQRSLIREGICLMDFEREVIRTYMEAISLSVADQTAKDNLSAHFSEGSEAVRRLATRRILLCGCNGKA